MSSFFCYRDLLMPCYTEFIRQLLLSSGMWKNMMSWHLRWMEEWRLANSNLAVQKHEVAEVKNIITSCAQDSLSYNFLVIAQVGILSQVSCNIITSWAQYSQVHIPACSTCWSLLYWSVSPHLTGPYTVFVLCMYCTLVSN